MTKPSLLLLACLHAGCSAHQPTLKCTSVIDEAALYRELAKDPHFAKGVPPPGKTMRIEIDVCEFKVHVRPDTADSSGGVTYIVNAKGKIVDIIEEY